MAERIPFFYGEQKIKKVHTKEKKTTLFKIKDFSNQGILILPSISLLK
jgi:hypothetical protein